MAAPRAAGMPVWWPRRPAAATAAVAAGAGPDFSCAGELEPADRPAIRGKCALGWVCRPPLWVWWSSLVRGLISLLGRTRLGSSVRAGALGCVIPRSSTFCVSAPLHVCLSSRYLRPVWECARGWCLRGVRFPRRALASAAAAARARRAIGRVFSAFVCGVTRRTAAARRSALFSVFVGVGRFSGVNKIGRLFGGASPLGCAFGLRLRAAPSGCAFGLRLRARPKPRLDSEPMGDARGRSRIPHKTPTADRGRSYGKKWPQGGNFSCFMAPAGPWELTFFLALGLIFRA